MSTFAKDWIPPRANRAFTGYVSKGQSSAGTVLHVMNNTKVPCTSEEYKKHGKEHLSVTIVGIKQLGFSYAPWKKNNKGGKPEGTKKLFDEPVTAVHQNDRVFSACKMYSFPREGKADKGPRADDVCSVVEVGQTLHFSLFDFMYEKKSKGENVFDEADGLIEPFNLLEIIVAPAPLDSAEKGYGMTLSCVRKLPYSLYSYLTPVNMQLVVTEYDALRLKMQGQQTDAALSVRMQLESNNVGFLAKLSVNTFVGESTVTDFVKLTSDEGSVSPGIHAIDVKMSDLLRYLNAGMCFLKYIYCYKITNM